MVNYYYDQVQLGSLLALIFAHKRCSTVDREAVAALDTKLKDERKRADDQVSSLSSISVTIVTYLQGAVLCWYIPPSY